MADTSLPPLGAVAHFQNQVNDLKARGKNLANYEIQQTKSGFALRNKNSLLTKISKFFHADQYDAAKNVAAIAKATDYFAGKSSLPIDVGSIHKALTTILQKQITSTGTQNWEPTNIALKALGTTFIQSEGKIIDRFDKAHGSFISDIEMAEEPLPDILKTHIPRIQDKLVALKETTFTSLTQKALEEARADLFETIHNALHKTDLPFYQYQEMSEELHKLNTDFTALIPHAEIPQVMTACFEKLEALKNRGDPRLMLPRLIQEFKESGKNPLELLAQKPNPLQQSLEELQEHSKDAYAALITNPHFIQQKDELLRLIIEKTPPQMDVASAHPTDSLIHEGRIVLKPDSENAELHAVATKWISKFPNAEQIRQTLGREDLSAMKINNNKMPQERIDTLQALRTKDTEFLAYAKTALLAEELAKQMQEAAPKKSRVEIESEVANLMGMVAKEYNPFGYLPISLQTLINSLGGPSDVPLSLSSSIPDSSKQVDQVTDRFLFEVGATSCNLTLNGIFTLTDGEAHRPFSITSRVEKPYGGDTFAGSLHLEPLK